MKTKSWILIALILVLASGCGSGDAKPVAAIQSPANGDTIAEGVMVPLVIAATEDTGVGIARVEVFVNGALFKTEKSPTGKDPVFNVSSGWQASAPGGYNIMVIAYAADDTASAPASIVLNIGGEGQLPASSETAQNTAPTLEPGAEWVQGEASEDAYIRTGPGIYCEIIKTVDAGTVMNLMEYSASMQYFMTDILGPTQIGWVWVDQVTILGDESLIKRGPRLGCLGCGDGTCSPEIGEDCSNCTEDCGSCCGNGTCEGGLGETCSTCQPDCGPCCGNGTCEGGLGEDCDTCEEDCGICEFCGDDICNAAIGETCHTCLTDCGFCIIVTMPFPLCLINHCGDGTCNCGETVLDCCDCSYCGDNICSCGESYSTCLSDCIG